MSRQNRSIWLIFTLLLIPVMHLTTVINPAVGFCMSAYTARQQEVPDGTLTSMRSVTPSPSCQVMASFTTPAFPW